MINKVISMSQIENQTHYLLRGIEKISLELALKPDTVLNLYSNFYLELFTKRKKKSKLYVLRRGLSLPIHVFENLIYLRLSGKLNNNISEIEKFLKEKLDQFSKNKLDSTFNDIVDILFYTSLFGMLVKHVGGKTKALDEISQTIFRNKAFKDRIDDLVNKSDAIDVKLLFSIQGKKYKINSDVVVKSILNRQNTSVLDSVITSALSYMSVEDLPKDKRVDLLVNHYNNIIKVTDSVNLVSDLSTDEKVRNYLIAYFMILTDYNKGMFLPYKEKINYVNYALSKDLLLKRIKDITDSYKKEKIIIKTFFKLFELSKPVEVPIPFWLITILVFGEMVAVQLSDINPIIKFFNAPFVVLLIMLYYFNKIKHLNEDIKNEL